MPTSNVTLTQPGDRFIDCASLLTPQVVKAAIADGVRGFMKYCVYDSTPRSKYWTRAEIDTVLDAGGFVMANWEIQADRALQGYAVGKSDGKRSRDWLRSIGYPEAVSAPVSVDMNTLASNFATVHDFCRGHWETDGDQCPSFGYLDTDGGRALADICDGIWIPGAFGWSPELAVLNGTLRIAGKSQAERNQAMAEMAAKNPQAIAIQFPSTAEYGIRVDQNVVLRPFAVWCADRPVPVVPPTPIPTLEEDDMPFIIQRADTQQCALVYDGICTGIAPQDVPVYSNRFGAPLVTSVEVFDDFAKKSGELLAETTSLSPVLESGPITVNVPPVDVNVHVTAS